MSKQITTIAESEAVVGKRQPPVPLKVIDYLDGHAFANASHELAARPRKFLEEGPQR